jgi:putative membrane protein
MMMMGFWVLLVAAVVWAIANSRQGEQQSTQNETPLDVLRRRYASGEITEEQFQQARSALG